MATTTNYGWTTPDDTALVKDGAAAIRSLGSSVDSSLGGAWTSWTPTFTNLTVGNGVLSAKYKKLDKTVMVNFSLTLGSTSTVGTDPYWNLPFTPAITYLSPAGYILDSGSATYAIWFNNSGGTTIYPVVQLNNTTYGSTSGITATIPFTWTTNDKITFWIVYETT